MDKSHTRHAIRISVGITILALFLVSGGIAAPYEQWNRTFGGPSNEQIHSVQQTSDGGYILAGYSGNFMWFLKADSNGNQMWNKTFGEPNYNGIFFSVLQTSDEGYILGGRSERWNGNCCDARLIKTDSNGNLEWDTNFGGASEYGSINYVQQTSDGGYILAGVIDWFEAWLIKTDSNRNQMWNRTFGDVGDGMNGAYFVQQTIDGGYIVAGIASKAGNPDGWLIKIDSNGNQIWNKTFGGISEYYLSDMDNTSDGGYILAGFSRPNSTSMIINAWLIKTDSNGNQMWNRTFEGNNNYIGQSVHETSDGGYILAVRTDVDNNEGILIKTDSNGNLVWNLTFGDYFFSSIEQTSDGGYILAGETNMFHTDNMDALLVKLSSDISVHNINKGTHYSTIQSGIDDADPGNEIHVDSGTYYENVLVNKQLILKGVDTGGGKPVIFGCPAIRLSSDWIKLEGFTTIGGQDCEGIFLYFSNNNMLIANNASSGGAFGLGIALSNSNNNTLVGNNIFDNNDSGITLNFANNNMIISNNISGNGNGIILYYSSNNNTIYNNKMNNTNNFNFGGSISKNTEWNTTKTSDTNIIGGPYIGGNFLGKPDGTGYSQTCADADRDGICDSAYILNANNIDYLPLAALPSIRLINGTVKDNSTGNSLAGVTVSANSTLSTTSDANGFYSFAVTDGSYDLKATFDIRYYTNATTVSTIGQAVVIQDIEMIRKPTGNITGSVTRGT